MNKQADIGLVGLAVMGQNLVLNMADHGFAVIGYDKNPDKTKLFESSATKNTIVKGVNALQEMIDTLKLPRKIMMLVPAGNPVESTSRYFGHFPSCMLLSWRRKTVGTKLFE